MIQNALYFFEAEYIVATPNVCGIAFTSINPIFLKILFKTSPYGKTEADSDKY